MKPCIIRYLTGLFFCLVAFHATAANVPVQVFPLSHYSQKLDQWLDPQSPGYNKPLLSYAQQHQRVVDYYHHLFSTRSGATSPWNKNHINRIFHTTSPDLETLEKNIIASFDNKGKSPEKTGYGENFRPHTENWIHAIAVNMNLTQFKNLVYADANRGIAVTNVAGRVLPTHDVSLNHFTLPGQGYPFDNLQMSLLLAGTPVYIVAHSRDKAWYYVITPSFFAWVPCSAIATVNKAFILAWQAAAKKQLAAIIQTRTPIVSGGVFRFYGYVGSVFPAMPLSTATSSLLLVPVRNKAGRAIIQYASVSANQAAAMPLKATPHAFSTLMATLLNRPYGWGGMYFYNDCSAELKSLYAPFGIWLPRHSSNQVTAGKMVDKSAKNIDKRLAWLLHHGHPLLTIVYLGGHVVMYLGHYTHPVTHDPVAMTYQNIWGLKPLDNSSRWVIGKSVLFPMLKKYPENPDLVSLAGKKYFQVSFLDEWSPALNTADTIDLKQLVYPEHMLNRDASD